MAATLTAASVSLGHRTLSPPGRPGGSAVLQVCASDAAYVPFVDWGTSEELSWRDSRLAAPAATTTRGADVDSGGQRTTVGEQRVAGRPVSLLVRRARALAEPTPCQQADPKLWFSESPADLERAKRLCRNCPLLAPCLAGAIDRAEPWGVWGGEIIHRGLIVTHKRARGRPRRESVTRSEFSPRQAATHNVGRRSTEEMR